jgi:NAD(P)-dependent dehydrogenase (short-subunit alcohol dehydrogenase family)
VSDEQSLCAAVEFAHRTFGDIHVLVNNAGYGLYGPVEAIPLSEARRQFEVNVFGAARLVQLIAPDMRRANWGRIVNVSSILGRVVQSLSGWYSASKFSLEALSDALRLELEPFGIFTVSILPGPVRTEFGNNVVTPELAADAPLFYRNLMKSRIGGREARPFEIPPEKVARVILRAIHSSRPRPRYVLTVPARVGFCLRRFLSDRTWDRLMAAYSGVNEAKRVMKG